LEQRLAEQQDLLRDYEKSLVERIADVDDDRRTTVTKLQRAWQTQREEIDEVLRRQTRTTFGMLLLFAVLIAVVLFLGYRQAERARQSLTDNMDRIEQDMGRLSGLTAQGEPSREELTRLSDTVGEISASLDRLGQERDGGLQAALGDEQATREKEDTRLGSAIRRLEEEQTRLVGELEALRGTLKALQVEAAARNAAAASAPGPETAAAGDENPIVAEAPAAVAEETQAKSAEEASPESEEAEDAGTEAVSVGNRTYALQLIGFFSRDALQQFVDGHDLPAQVYLRQGTYRGRPWFTLIHSLHESYAEAEAELSRLPADLVALEPWIRPLKEGDELKIVGRGAGR